VRGGAAYEQCARRRTHTACRACCGNHGRMMILSEDRLHVQNEL
jgi:hypothetical protein